ncbi:STAS domain-containing protein [Saccharothrix sp. HUAS TT1]|uniref:STAS domain-containing protein n=1 Tax=unclassified Saccharothrix TaxID=2593673 RepID=UPI00345C246F
MEREMHGYAVVVRVAGEVDASTVRELKNEIAVGLALATTPAPLVVDLSEVRFFAAAGLNEVYRGLLAARAVGVQLRVVARHRHVLRPFEASGLDQEIRPCRTLAEALAVRTIWTMRRFTMPLASPTPHRVTSMPAVTEHRVRLSPGC